MKDLVLVHGALTFPSCLLQRDFRSEHMRAPNKCSTCASSQTHNELIRSHVDSFIAFGKTLQTLGYIIVNIPTFLFLLFDPNILDKGGEGRMADIKKRRFLSF